MKIVIVEDEIMIARRISTFVNNILGERLTLLKHFLNLEDAEDYLDENDIDLLLLDLNLNNRDGFELLRNRLAASYYTIVISANTDRAMEAFELGVLDFIGKPFKQERIEKALKRITNDTTNGSRKTKYLSIKKYGRIELLDIKEILYIEASGHYSEITLIDGSKELHDKNLEKLVRLLPDNFERVHKSYAIAIDQVKSLHKHPGSKYELELRNSKIIPLGRTHYVRIKRKLEGS